MKIGKRIDSPFYAALSVSVLLVVTFTLFFSTVSAHPPSNMELSYDPIAGKLRVNIGHRVGDISSHYIESVVIRNNGNVVLEENYQDQQKRSGGTFEYDLSASNLGRITVEAECNRFGQISRSIKEVKKIDFDEYRWSKRPLYVFSPTSDREDYQKQLNDISSREDGIEDRDMIVHLVLEKGASFAGDLPLETAAVQQLREKFSVSPGDFSVILVGKDGGVKLRKGEYVPMSDIFDLIDSMPMRKSEMEEEE